MTFNIPKPGLADTNSFSFNVSFIGDVPHLIDGSFNRSDIK